LDQQKNKFTFLQSSTKWFITDPRQWLKFIGVVLGGGCLGYLYYRWFGCHQACPISGDAWLMIGFGLVSGINLAWGIIRKQTQPVAVDTTNSRREG